jgi:signal transduction histidine kinase
VLVESPFFAGVRGPLRQVLRRLEGASPGVARSWRALLRRLDAGHQDGSAWVGSLDLAACFRPLRARGASGDEAYGQAVRAAADSLMSSGVEEDQAVAAIGLYLEACLALANRPAELRALARLTSASQRLVVAAYGDERDAARRRLDDRERKRFSGDLHDEVGADLVVLKLYVEMIALELAKGRVAEVGAKLQEALVLIAHATESVRRLALDLGPAFLDSVGFAPAIRGVVRQFTRRTGIAVELDEGNAAVSLPASYETALYRVLLEALSNVAKHSHARHVKVSLRPAGKLFAMSVVDDGQGFDTRAVDRGFGLTAMRERIRGLRGRLSIESRPGRRRGEQPGTRIEVRLPLRKGLVS